jgi:hypothetical protein
MSHFLLSAALALLGQMDEARVTVGSGLVLNPQFTIARFRTASLERGPVFVDLERIVEGLLKAGLPEGVAKAN